MTWRINFTNSASIVVSDLSCTTALSVLVDSAVPALNCTTVNIANGTTIRFITHTSTGAAASSLLTVQSVTDIVDPPFNWQNTNNLLQACLVASCVFALLFGYRSGDKL